MVSSAVAFLVTLAAGACTAIGAAFVALPKRYLSQKTFSAALGFSGGVMLYISFIEIFVKAYDEFQLAFHTGGEDEDPSEEVERDAYIAATGSMFAGMVLTWLLDVLVHMLHKRAGTESLGTHSIEASADTLDCCGEAAATAPPAAADGKVVAGATDALGDVVVRVASPPAKGDALVAKGAEPLAEHVDDAGTEDSESIKSGEADSHKVVGGLVGESALVRMSLVTGLAIALHNFPEGLATFISTKADTEVGLSVAIAIGIHNIPEGLAVAMPLYSATGSMWKAFAVGALSGVSEPLGALIGWVAFSASDPDSFAYAISFSAVAGMMIFITMFEILPVALKADPENQVVAKSMVLGMAVMAASLILFQL